MSEQTAKSDSLFVVSELTKLQGEDKHGEMVVKIRDGKVQIVEITERKKPLT